MVPSFWFISAGRVAGGGQQALKDVRDLFFFYDIMECECLFPDYVRKR